MWTTSNSDSFCDAQKKKHPPLYRCSVMKEVYGKRSFLASLDRPNVSDKICDFSDYMKFIDKALFQGENQFVLWHALFLFCLLFVCFFVLLIKLFQNAEYDNAL